MKWIKASESLPEVFYGEFVVKKNGRKLITTFDQKTGFGISGNIEWLDESPAPAKTAEEVEKTQKFLNPYSVDEKEKYGIFHLGFYSGYTTSLQSQPCQTGYSREDMVNALIEFIAYRSKVGTTDIANDAKQFESRFYLQEKSLTNKPTTDDTKNKKAN